MKLWRYIKASLMEVSSKMVFAKGATLEMTNADGTKKVINAADIGEGGGINGITSDLADGVVMIELKSDYPRVIFRAIDGYTAYEFEDDTELYWPSISAGTLPFGYPSWLIGKSIYIGYQQAYFPIAINNITSSAYYASVFSKQNSTDLQPIELNDNYAVNIITVTSNCTLTDGEIPSATGTAWYQRRVRLEVTGAPHTITWPATWEWDGETLQPDVDGTYSVVIDVRRNTDGSLTQRARTELRPGGVVIPDVSALDGGGNARGTNAVNLQSGRTTAANVASGLESVAVGYDAEASGVSCVSVGPGALASNTYSIAIGSVAQATTGGIAAGQNAISSGSSAIAVGQNTRADALQSTALGNSADAGGDYAVAVGASANAAHAGSVALGRNSTTTAIDQVMIGGRDLEITDTTKGVIMVSPDGTRYRLEVANGGALSAVAVV